MGHSKLLWQTFKCFLLILNSQQGHISHLEEILELMQQIFNVVKGDLPKDQNLQELQNSIFWELCAFKQRIRDFITSIYEKLHILKRIPLGFTARASPPRKHKSYLAACPEQGSCALAACPDLADFPDGPCSQAPPCRKPQPQQEVDSPPESLLRNQLDLAERLYQLASELQDVLL
nr:agnoprotein [Bat polyomavirus BtSY1]